MILCTVVCLDLWLACDNFYDNATAHRALLLAIKCDQTQRKKYMNVVQMFVNVIIRAWFREQERVRGGSGVVIQLYGATPWK